MQSLSFFVVGNVTLPLVIEKGNRKVVPKESYYLLPEDAEVVICIVFYYIILIIYYLRITY